jgi:hypothetical protein
MINYYVLPRLDQRALKQLIVLYRDELEGNLDLIEKHVSSRVLSAERSGHSAVGVERISEEELSFLKDELVKLAIRFGYPGDPSDSGAYDRATAAFLLENLHVYPADAGEQAVWAHFNGWLVPHLVAWRWGLRTFQEGSDSIKGAERFGLGPRWWPRNQMGRLWWRAYFLGNAFTDGHLGEDQLTAIVERPSIVGIKVLTENIVQCWQNSSRREDVMRDAIKRIRLFLPNYDLANMSADDVGAKVKFAFETAEAHVDT